MEVILVRWPEESTRLSELRGAASPRLLLVGPGSLPPGVVRPARGLDPAPGRRPTCGPGSRRSRPGRSSRAPAPVLDDDGLLRFRQRWVSLSPVERGLAGALVERFGAVVGRDVLARRAWPDGAPTRNALDVHMLRLRRRIAPLGLEVRTVRSRGYLLQALEPAAPAMT